MKLAEWGLTRKANNRMAKDRSSRKRDRLRRRDVEGESDNDDADGDESDSTVIGSSNDQRDPENLESMVLSRAAAHTGLMETETITTGLALFDGNLKYVTL
jgi:hypothetical protein